MTLPNRHLPLTALRSFEAAARLLSFKDAAAELCVSATTISNQIRQLERDWGCQLFIRKTRAVALTDAGRSLAQVVSRAFDDIRAEVATHIATPRKWVTLAVGPIFGARWLIPRLGRFRRLHPDIDLRLHHGPRITSDADMTTQIAIDWGTGTWSGLNARKLIEISYSPVASPALLREKGGLSDPADLARFPVIHQHDRSEWTAWLALTDARALTFAEETVITDSNVVLQAAKDGLGVTLGVFPFVQPDIDSGTLVQPFAQMLHPERAFHLLTRRAVPLTPEARRTCDWILSEAGLPPVKPSFIDAD
ncbi:LysR substrate-binding domain-containing protein [Nioella aestuarii]|uniref:LysR substrate-binding domain-containing protein n=1 Tax=Nioella aestuarii TaxID=1662864 RepID=UPI003D7F765D